MPLSIACTQGHEFKVAASRAGSTVRCPHCREKVMVVDPATRIADEPPAQKPPPEPPKVSPPVKSSVATEEPQQPPAKAKESTPTPPPKERGKK
ncbi:MAG: hypothetical protein NXI22_18240, partial [bacterium]|nr:hypothetical protein [bacterium]